MSSVSPSKNSTELCDRLAELGSGFLERYKRQWAELKEEYADDALARKRAWYELRDEYDRIYADLKASDTAPVADTQYKLPDTLLPNEAAAVRKLIEAAGNRRASASRRRDFVGAHRLIPYADIDPNEVPDREAIDWLMMAKSDESWWRKSVERAIQGGQKGDGSDDDAAGDHDLASSLDDIAERLERLSTDGGDGT